METTQLHWTTKDGKRIHGQTKPWNLPDDATPFSPFPCDFELGDRVVFTNDYGVQFTEVIRGFAKAKFQGRFIYVFTDAWWMPVAPESLKKL